MSQYPAFDHRMQFKIRDNNAIRKSAQTRLLLVILGVAVGFGIRNWNHTMLWVGVVLTKYPIDICMDIRQICIFLSQIFLL